MKRIHHFLNTGIPDNALSGISGGSKTIKTTYNGQCDIHHDDNDNGTIDPGECVEFVECENTK